MSSWHNQPMQPKVCIVVALSSKQRAIGANNKLLWHIPDDLKRFKKLTLNKPVIMGRKTFESIVSYLGKPLPGRTNILVTRNQEYSYEGVKVVSSLKEGLNFASTLGTEEIHIGGGSEIYKQALPLVDRLYLTLIEDEPKADTFFPAYETEFTKVISDESHKYGDISYTWRTLER